MDGLDSLVSGMAQYPLAALAAGICLGWLIKSVLYRYQSNTLESVWEKQLDDVVQQRNISIAETNALQSSIEPLQAEIQKCELEVNRAESELSSALEKEDLMTENISTLRAEREDFKTKMSNFQNRLTSVQKQSGELQFEFLKSRDFYVGELKKSFEKRSTLEEKLEDSYKEHESVRNLLNSSKSQQDSVNKMFDAAKARLDNLDTLEKNVIDLEAENSKLKLHSSLAKQESDALQRDVAEQDELRVRNEELSQVVKSMEDSSKQYEEDANRYREHSDKHEHESETLRLRLSEVEQNFAELEQQQRDALKDARRPAAAAQTPEAQTAEVQTPAARTPPAHIPNESKPTEIEKDDLQEIIGIGRVFEHSLHELGITSFRQIANFDVDDIDRVNAELNEFKGRMEQDDWIGQARDLLYKKYDII